MSIFRSTIILSSILSVFGCASAPSTRPVPKWVETYYFQIRHKVEPLWAKKTSQEIKRLRASGLTVQQLKAPENTVKLEFDIDRSGKIENIQQLQKSTYSFFNEVALNTLNEAGTMMPPPAECLKEEKCKIRWDFILKTN